MTPEEILATARAAGVSLRADGDLIKYAPADAMPPDLRAQLVAAKLEVLALLRREAASEPAPAETDARRCSDCGLDGFTVMLVTGCGDLLCRTCWRETTAMPKVRGPATPDLDRLLEELERA